MTRDPRQVLLEEFLDQLAHQRRLSAGTARNYRRALEELFVLNPGARLDKLDSQQLRRTVSKLHARGMSGRTIAYMISGWRGFFAWLVKHRGFSGNPCIGLRAPKSPKALPKALSPDLMARLLEGPANAPAQLRDKAMFELLYSSGLRLAELVSLDIADAEGILRQAEVTVTGKGEKTRTVPVGSKARAAAGARKGGRTRAFRRGARKPHQRELGAPRPFAVGASSRPAAARSSSHAAAFLRDPRAAILRGPARGTGDARALEHLDDAGLHAPGLSASRQGVRRGPP